MNPNISESQFGPGKQLPMFMTPHEVASLRTNDFPEQRVQSNRQNMNRSWGMMGTGVDDYRHINAGGATKYIANLERDVNSEGGIKTPARVHLGDHPRTPRSQRVDRTDATLTDGNHRAVVAMETNRLVPVHYVSDY